MRAPVVTRVELSADGFTTLNNEAATETVAWAQIESISTYKVDCHTYDRIWLAFESKGRELALHISEDAEGFENLMLALNEAFPNIDPAWYQNVMLPVFDEKFTTLFRRPEQS